MGFEPTTPTLARLCSTPELRPHSSLTRHSQSRYKEQPNGEPRVLGVIFVRCNSLRLQLRNSALPAAIFRGLCEANRATCN